MFLKPSIFPARCMLMIHSNAANLPSFWIRLNIHLNPCQSSTEALQRFQHMFVSWDTNVPVNSAYEDSMIRPSGASYYRISKLIAIYPCASTMQKPKWLLSGNGFMIVRVLPETGNIQSVDGHILFPPGSQAFICKWKRSFWSASDVCERVKLFPCFSGRELPFPSILSFTRLILLIYSLQMWHVK